MSWAATIGTLALEAAIVGALVWAIAASWKRGSSALRYGLLGLAILKFVAPPIAAPWTVPLELPVSTRSAESIPASDPPFVTDASVAAPERTGALSDPDSNDASAFTPRADSPDRPAASRSAPVDWRMALAVLYIAGAVILVLRRALQVRSLRALLAASSPVTDAGVVAMLDSVAARQGLRRTPALRKAPAGVGPAAVGLLRPTILIPASLLGAKRHAELRAVLAHEVAHHRRRDLWVEWLIFLGSVVWWCHPIYWLVGREMRLLREDCCDDAAAQEVGGAAVYCQLLLDAARDDDTLPGSSPALAPGSFSHPLGRRIRRLMNPEHTPTPRVSAMGTVALVVAAFLVVPAATRAVQDAPPAPPVVAVAPAAPATPAPVGSATAPPPAVPAPALAGDPIESIGVEPAPPQAGQATSRSWTLSTPRSQSGSRSVWYEHDGNSDWGSLNGSISISRGAVEDFAERGLDPDFVAGLDGTDDRQISIDEFRDWSRYGFEAGLADALESIGVSSLGVIDALRIVWVGVDSAYVRSLRDAGIPGLDIDDIVRLSRYGVTGEFIGAFRQQGYTDLGTDDLVRLHRYGVDPDYAGTYREAGYDLSVDELVRLHRYGVDEQAAARLLAAGLDHFSTDDLVRLQRYDVDDDYIREMTNDGQVDVSTDALIRLKRYGVDPEYARQMRGTGLSLTTDELVTLKRYDVAPTTASAMARSRSSVSADELVRLHRYGVTADYIDRMAAAVETEFDTDGLITLKRYSVEPEFIGAMQATGLSPLGVDDLVRLKRYEVDPDFVQQLVDGGFEDLTVDRVIRMQRAAR